MRTAGLAAAGLIALAGAIAQAAPPPSADQQRTQAFAQASGTQAGTVKQQTGGVLTIQPYNSASNLTQFQLPSNTPVFQGKGTITPAGLMPGTNVRVHYRPQGNTAQAVAVEVLTGKDIASARTQAQQSPPAQLAQVVPMRTPTAPAPAGTPSPGAAPSSLKQAIAQSKGSQPGKITKISNGTLLLRPYQKAAGEATLKFDPKTPVYKGEVAVSSKELTPGTDVRVYYSADRRQAVAVEILDPTQAHALEKSEQNIQRGK